MPTAQHSSSSGQALLRGAGIFLIALALLYSAPTRAQDGDTVTMNMRDADIRGLIQWIADQTGKNMVVHKDVAGKVTVLSAKPVSREEAYRVFLSVLQVHGYAAIETPEAVKIVPVAIASQSGVPYSGSPTGDMVVQVFKATNVGANELAQMLKPLVSKDAVINADSATNLLLIADHAANVAGLQELVRKMDRSGGSEVELVRLQHASAREVVASLGTLFPVGTAGPAAGAEGGGAALAVTFSADERSNSVLLSGDAVKRNQIRNLIRQMDTPLTGTGNTRVVYLQYADAKELVPILKSLAQSVLKEQKDKETSVSIEASESANALVINAPAGLVDTLRDVVTRLDIRRAQVLVEALIVEVSNDGTDELGVIWATTDADDANGSAGFAAINTLGGLADDPGTVVRNEDTRAIEEIRPGRGVTFGYFKNGNLQAAIRAVRANTKANILSTPTVVAIDNEPASLLVGQNVPFITGQSTGAAASTENPFTTIERKDIGTSLEITPRINRGDAITLEIKQKVENIAPTVENASDLVTNKREIVTKALIQSGQVLVLGGLIGDEQSEFQEKVPILGDLPLIGRLFSGTSKSRTKTNLMVFLHPVILKDEQHVSEISRARYDYMREQQRRHHEEPPPSTERHAPPPALLEDFEVFSPVNRPALP